MDSTASTAGGPTIPPAAAPSGARTIGDFVIEAEIARGASTTVYRARDVRLDRAVALRVFPADPVVPGAGVAFERRLAAWAALDVEGIPAVWAFHEIDGARVAVLPWYRGVDLGACLATRRLAPDQVVAVTRAVGATLTALHAFGVVHGAVAPSHVLVTRTDDATAARVVLFGPAVGPRGDGIADEEWCVAPEQGVGRAATVAGDVFSLAALAYHAATGFTPFGLRSDGYGGLVPNGPAYWSDDLAALPAGGPSIIQGLAVDPTARIASPSALVAALEPDVRPVPRAVVPPSVARAAEPPPPPSGWRWRRGPARPSRRRSPSGPGVLHRSGPRGPARSSRRSARPTRRMVISGLVIAAAIAAVAFGMRPDPASSASAPAPPTRREMSVATRRALFTAVPPASRARCRDVGPRTLRCRLGATALVVRRSGGGIPPEDPASSPCVPAPAVVAGSWSATPGGALRGRVRCNVGPGGSAVVVWTDTRAGTTATATRADGDGAALWRWWLAHGRTDGG